MNVLAIVLDTLIIYSLISFSVFLLSNENEDVFAFFGMGITGWIIFGLYYIIERISNHFKYHHNKRSIFLEESTGNKYICKVKDAEYFSLWMNGYRVIKRYANKSEWKDIPYLSDELIEKSKMNCDNCKYDEECVCEFPYDKIKCKHDKYGTVLEFDKFEKR